MDDKRSSKILKKKKHKLYNKFLTKRTSNNERKVQGMQVII